MIDIPLTVTSPENRDTGPAGLDRLPLGLISNSCSGRNRKQLHTIEEIVAKHPAIHHRVTRNSGEVPTVLAELADRAVGILAINGGDGTVARVLGCMLEDAPFVQPPSVILLPGGTTNMDVGDVGLRGNLKSAVTRLCRWADSAERRCRVLRRPVLRVVPGNGQPAVYGMFFGAGAIIQSIEYCRASLPPRSVGNVLGPGLTLVRTLWGIMRGDRRFVRPVEVCVAFDDAPPGAAQQELLLLITGLERLSLGIRPYWGREDAPLHMSLVRQGAEHFLRNVPGLLRGRPGRHANSAAGYRSHNAGHICLEMEAGWTLDGELYRAQRSAGPVTISAAGPVTFLRL